MANGYQYGTSHYDLGKMIQEMEAFLAERKRMNPKLVIFNEVQVKNQFKEIKEKILRKYAQSVRDGEPNILEAKSLEMAEKAFENALNIISAKPIINTAGGQMLGPGEGARPTQPGVIQGVRPPTVKEYLSMGFSEAEAERKAREYTPPSLSAGPPGSPYPLQGNIYSLPTLENTMAGDYGGGGGTAKLSARTVEEAITMRVKWLMSPEGGSFTQGQAEKKAAEEAGDKEYWRDPIGGLGLTAPRNIIRGDLTDTDLPTQQETQIEAIKRSMDELANLTKTNEADKKQIEDDKKELAEKKKEKDPDVDAINALQAKIDAAEAKVKADAKIIADKNLESLKPISTTETKSEAEAKAKEEADAKLKVDTAVGGPKDPRFGSMTTLDPELRRVQLDQVPISQYTKGLPSMLPGGSVAPLRATYENMMPQLETAYSMAQKLGLVDLSDPSLPGGRGSGGFEAWLSTNPDIRGIMKAGLDKLENLRATLNALPEGYDRDAAIRGLGAADRALFAEYLSPTIGEDGTILDAYAGAKNELNLRLGLNQYLPAETRYAANQALYRNFNQSMTRNPLNQYNLYQGMDRPSGFGETPYPFAPTALDPMPTPTAPLGTPQGIPPIPIPGSPPGIPPTPPMGQPNPPIGQPAATSSIPASQKSSVDYMRESLQNKLPAGVSDFGSLVKFGNEATSDDVNAKMLDILDPDNEVTTGMPPSTSIVPAGMTKGPIMPSPTEPPPPPIDPTTYYNPLFRPATYQAQGVPDPVGQANIAYANYQAQQRKDQGIDSSGNKLPAGVKLKTWYDAEGNQQNMLIRT